MSLQLFSCPSDAQGLIFDIDKTLYHNDPYADKQIETLIQRLAEERSQSFAEANDEVRKQQALYAEKNDGVRQSLGNLFKSMGIPIETSVNWRNELLSPEDYLKEDEQLKQTLLHLSERYVLTAITNNPVGIGRRTLDTLGILSSFKYVFGLDTLMKSKPNSIIFLNASEALGFPCTRCISIGDRYDVDIIPALSIGMGGILVDNVSDVYDLPDLFERNDL